MSKGGSDFSILEPPSRQREEIEVYGWVNETFYVYLYEVVILTQTMIFSKT